MSVTARGGFGKAMSLRKTGKRLLKAAQRRYCFLLAAIALVLATFESACSVREDRSIASLAREVVQRAGAKTPREKVLAIRDYLRRNVTYENAPFFNRPFLRASAMETLQTGKGYCGEVTRTFICMADSVDVQAQRVNIYGRRPHVMAEAELGPDERVIVECQSPPTIVDLEPLDKVMLRPEDIDYATVNLRRTGLGWVVTRMKLRLGPLTYWTERPYALKAAGWTFLATLLLGAVGIRRLVRWLLHRRGWVHRSELSNFSSGAALIPAASIEGGRTLEAPCPPAYGPEPLPEMPSPERHGRIAENDIRTAVS